MESMDAILKWKKTRIKKTNRMISNVLSICCKKRANESLCCTTKMLDVACLMLDPFAPGLNRFKLSSNIIQHFLGKFSSSNIIQHRPQMLPTFYIQHVGWCWTNMLDGGRKPIQHFIQHQNFPMLDEMLDWFAHFQNL